MSTMGERIRSSREMKNLLQSELASLIGVKSGGIISNWENDINKPDAEKIVRLCQVLDVSASYLLDYYGEDAPAAPRLSAEAAEIARCFDVADDSSKALIRHVVQYVVQSMHRSSSGQATTAAQAAAAYLSETLGSQSRSQEVADLKNG